MAHALAIFEENGKGTGKAALDRLPDSELRKLSELCNGGSLVVAPSTATRSELVGAVLRWKARVAKQHCRSPAGKENETQKAPIEENDSPPSTPRPQNRVVRPAFEPARAQIRIVSFNTLKLRVDDPELEASWEEVFDLLASADVVVLQEVPSAASAVSKRVGKVLQEVQYRSGGTGWDVRTSKPIGKMKGEIHVVLAKAPLVVAGASTLQEAGGAPFCHCPLIVHLRGGPALQEKELVVTSVHMPPVSRQRERCVQTKALLSLYKSSSSTRQDTPFTDKGARDAGRPSAVHVLCGDWNCPMASDEALLQFLGSDYVALLGTGACTTVGGKQYDNFVVSRNLASHFELSSGVERLAFLQNSSAKVKGLSDHSPIRLDLVPHPT